MSIFCRLGFHDYQETSYGINWRLHDKNQWQRCHFGWKEFRKCSCCGKIQFRDVSTSYSRITNISDWLEMNKSAKKTLEMYNKF